MDDLYRDYILDHYKQPRNFGELEPHDLEALEHNPLCGDELGVHIRVSDDRIEDIRFHGHGCAISQASASIASEELKGMTLAGGGRAGRGLDDRAAGHPGVGDAAQVRAAEPEGGARRGHGRSLLAGVSAALRRVGVAPVGESCERGEHDGPGDDHGPALAPQPWPSRVTRPAWTSQ